jgi:hypothetical protein
MLHNHIDLTDVQTGDGLLVRNKFNPLKDPLSLLYPFIWLFTWNKFNHGGMFLFDEGKWWIVESVYPVAIKTELQEYLAKKERKYQVVRFFSLLPEAERKRRVLGLVGKPYDLYSLLIAQPIYQVTGIWIGCTKSKSEYAQYCFEALANIHKELFTKPWKATANTFTLINFNYYAVKQ